MSVWQDIWDFIGPAGKPAVVAGLTLGAFQWIESSVSEELKKAAAHYIRSFDVHTVTRLPVGTLELFQHLFGSKHLSLFCIRRSILFSVVWLCILTIFAYLFYRQPLLDNISNFLNSIKSILWRPYFTTHLAIVLVLAMCIIRFAWVFFIDYVSLLKTRLILGLWSKEYFGGWLVHIAILVGDLVIGVLIFCIRNRGSRYYRNHHNDVDQFKSKYCIQSNSIEHSFGC
jgi:hypothetical protein